MRGGRTVRTTGTRRAAGVRRLGCVMRARMSATATLAVLAALVPAAGAWAGGSGPPVNTVAPSISGQAKEGTTLTAKNGSWTGATPLSYTYLWEHDEAGQWKAIEGAAESKFAPTAPYVGQQIRARVLASNSAGETSATTAPTEPVAAAPPKNHEAPSISPAEPVEGQLLTAKAGKWEGTPASEYVYEWESCSKKCAVVATHQTTRESDSYRAPEESGSTFRVTVTDENPAGSKSAKSASTAAVKAGPPGRRTSAVDCGRSSRRSAPHGRNGELVRLVADPVRIRMDELRCAHGLHARWRHRRELHAGPRTGR